MGVGAHALIVADFEANKNPMTTHHGGNGAGWLG